MSNTPLWLELSLYPYRIQKQILGQLIARSETDPVDFISSALRRCDFQADSTQLRTLILWSETSGQGVVCFDQLPIQLQEISNPPAVLYYRGNLDLLHTQSVAVVGSRKPSPAGMENAQWFSQVIAASGVTVLSGLAHGIDQIAHETTLAVAGKTIAILGCGLDYPYPVSATPLYEAIIEQGLLLSEFIPSQGISRWQFPRRNRLISGLSDGVLVVEAALKSGSLVTANLAAEQGRQVFAIPGDIQNPMIAGCHHIIREGAQLVSSPQEVLAAVSWQTTMEQPEPAMNLINSQLTEQEKSLLESLDRTPRHIDVIRARSGFELTLVLNVLFSLELKGMIVSSADGYYKPNQGDTFQ